MAKEEMHQSSPALNRAQRAALALPNKVAGSAVHTMFHTFRDRQSMTRFHDWRVDPTTMLLVEVLRELALVPTLAHHFRQTPEIEYGVMQGISLCAQLLNDPSSIYAELFSDPTPEGRGELPESTYDTPPDGVYRDSETREEE